MKNITSVLILIFCAGCVTNDYKNIEKYYHQVNQAELFICKNDFKKALSEYLDAFGVIHKPFGKDIFNAALCAQLTNDVSSRDKYLQSIVNNSDDLDYVRSTFVNEYMTPQEWDALLFNRTIDYDQELRDEFKEIRERDQLFRPMYDTYDDTINANRIINLTRILKLTDSQGFPSHIKLGFTNYLRGQNHDIVLHHTAQRRSRDKTVMDLEPILLKAVREGRFDPETAIFYMNFQNDQDKGRFEVYSTNQITHHLLPDSLNEKIWLPNLNKEQIVIANRKRKEWFANSLEDIAVKTEYLSYSSTPFIFTSVKKSSGSLRDDFDKETALQQYNMATSYMKEYRK